MYYSSFQGRELAQNEEIVSGPDSLPKAMQMHGDRARKWLPRLGRGRGGGCVMLRAQGFFL